MHPEERGGESWSCWHSVCYSVWNVVYAFIRSRRKKSSNRLTKRIKFCPTRSSNQNMTILQETWLARRRHLFSMRRPPNTRMNGKIYFIQYSLGPKTLNTSRTGQRGMISMKAYENWKE